MYVSVQMNTEVSYQPVTTDLVNILVFWQLGTMYLNIFNFPFPAPLLITLLSCHQTVRFHLFLFSTCPIMCRPALLRSGACPCVWSATSGHMIRINRLTSSSYQKPIGGISCPCQCTCKDYIWLGLEQVLCILS